MKRKPFALLLAAALLAGTVHTAIAEDAPDTDAQEYSQEWRHGRGPDGRRGGPRGWHRGGPDREGTREGGWHRGGEWHRGGPERGDWRCGPGRDGDFGRHGGPRRGPGRGPHHGDFGIGFGGARAFDALKLDDAQKARVLDVMTANFRARLEAKMALTEARRTLRDLRDDDAASADAIVAANAAVGEAQGRLDVLGRSFRDDMRGILTEEQIEQLEEMHMGPRPFGGREGRGPGGPGERRPARPEGAPGPRR